MEEKIYYKMYQEELEGIVPCSPREQKELVNKLLQGDNTVVSRLVEGNLARVIVIAQEFDDKGVLIEDLVAEGNLALALAVDSYIVGDFDVYIEDAIRTAMKEIVEEQAKFGEAGTNLAVLLNVLDEVSKRLAEQYGREATVTEIAEKMKMSEDTIKQLTKMALDAVSASVQSEEEEEMYVEEDMLSEDNILSEDNQIENDTMDVDLDKEFDFDTDSEYDI